MNVHKDLVLLKACKELLENKHFNGQCGKVKIYVKHPYV